MLTRAGHCYMFGRLAARVFVPIVALAGLLGCGESGQDSKAASKQTLRIAESVFPTLDPAFLSTPQQYVTNIFDPLVKLDEKLQAVPALAERWDISGDGKKVTFHLRPDGKWTNGDPVTARDFEYSWKRVLTPDVESGFAFLLFGVDGATAYNACKTRCDALRDRVGIRARGDYALEVRLATPQPWFPQVIAHPALVAVHEATVERFGEKWTSPDNIVTNGPFKVVAWEPERRIALAKWHGWRAADQVALERVDIRMFSDSRDAQEAYERDELDVQWAGLPRPAHPDVSFYPLLITWNLAVNVKTITDPNQRRAMALAINRRAAFGRDAATSYTPKGMPGIDVIAQHFLEPTADLARAKRLMRRAKNVRRSVEVWTFEGAIEEDALAKVTTAWRALGIEATVKSYEFVKLQQLLGPPPSDRVDVFMFGWGADFPDDVSFLAVLTCASSENKANFCDRRYDRLVARAARIQDPASRYDIYARLEAMLTGPNGAFPVIPLYWNSAGALVRASVRDTFNIDPRNFVDLTKVVVEKR